MSKLSKLYELRRLSQEFGMEWTEKQERQLEAEEEHLIKNEVLPVVSKNIEPALAQVERELVLVVDYIPGSPLKVSLSRKRNIADVLPDAVEIKPDPEVQHKTYGSRNVGKGDIAPKTRLRVIMPNGQVITHAKAKDTFIEAILTIGIERVRSLGLKFCKIPIISNTRDKKYGRAQHDVGNGWMILTHSSTADKKKMLDKIAKVLNIKLRVEII
ncbi:MAG: hypothetical protein DBY35_14590 [Bacteroidales bacterium]|uniref:hypothetical protein n=1 Tax=Bacteroides acidifaciens TaxID=85831 RepID=UPI000D7A2DFA|nr:hypothetical protein [Bacteroides acidifaciens]PWL58089.1 MAG: hypothetical protein DBY35_14590 [Bacteroidales bacterium]